MALSARFEEKHSFTLTWDFEIDTNATTARLKLPVSTRFGEVYLAVTVEGAQTLNVDCFFFRYSIGCLGRATKKTGVLSFLDAAEKATEVSRQMWATDQATPDRWPGSPGLASGQALGRTTPEMFRRCAKTHPEFKLKEHRRFRYEIKFLDAEPAAYIATAPLPPKSMRVAVASISSQCPNNLRLFFPRANAELWTNAEALVEASPYFKTLLASEGFAESVVRGRKRARTGSAVVKVEGGREASQQATPPAAGAEGEGEQAAEDGAEGGADDSDDGTDDFIKQSGATGAGQEEINPYIAYREVTITESAYSTYRAVLVYLHTSHITFAPLASSLLPSSSIAKLTRIAYLRKTAERAPSLPLPVSPKAVYALAHLLELPNLMALALADIHDSLTIDNAARELFSRMSITYDEVRQGILAFVVKDLAEVKETAGWKDVQGKISRGELPEAAPTLMELFAKSI